MRNLFFWLGCAFFSVFLLSRGGFALVCVLFVIFLLGVLFMKLFGLLDP